MADAYVTLFKEIFTPLESGEGLPPKGARSQHPDSQSSNLPGEDSATKAALGRRTANPPAACEACRVPLASDHVCPMCGVGHSIECPACRRWGFHLDGCPEMAVNRRIADRLGAIADELGRGNR